MSNSNIIANEQVDLQPEPAVIPSAPAAAQPPVAPAAAQAPVASPAAVQAPVAPPAAAQPLVVPPAAVQAPVVPPAVVQPLVMPPAAVLPLVVPPAAVQVPAVPPAAVQPLVVPPTAVQAPAAPPAAVQAPAAPPAAAQPAPVKAVSDPLAPKLNPVQEAKKPLADSAVLAHTSSLWHYQPRPKDEPDIMPEYLIDAERLHDAQVTAARVRGKKHKNEGTNSDDWYEVSEACDDVVILAVADGAGSKRFSRVGARAACEGASAFLQKAWQDLESSHAEFRAGLGQDLNDPAVKDSAMAAYGRAAQLMQGAIVAGFDSLKEAFEARRNVPGYSKLLGRDLTVEDLGCTLLLAVSVPIGDGVHAIFTCQVGDGMIAIIDSQEDDPAKALRLLAEADSGEFSGETDFLTSKRIVAASEDGSYPELQRRTRVTRTKADHLLLMSDGVADDYYPNDPEMLRLYYDLMLNGVLGDMAMGGVRLDNPAEAEMFHNLPQPRSFLSVTENPQEVKLLYAKDIEDKLKLDTASLWKQQAILRQASIFMKDHVRRISDGAEKSEILAQRLCDWLDNYTERGSFDDRTLVIARLRR